MPASTERTSSKILIYLVYKSKLSGIMEGFEWAEKKLTCVI